MLDDSQGLAAANSILRDRVEKLEAERDQFRKDAADAAALRRAFNAAVAAFQEAGKRLKPLREGEPPPAGERALMAPWQKLYEAVRDTQAGLGILAENAALAAHVGELAAACQRAVAVFSFGKMARACLTAQQAERLEAVLAMKAALAPDAARRALARLRALEGLAAVAAAFNFCRRWIQFPPGTDADRWSELYGRAEAGLAAWEAFSVTEK